MTTKIGEAVAPLCWS